VKLLLAIVLGSSVLACRGPDALEDSADRAADLVLREKGAELESRESTVVRPDRATPAASAPVPEAPGTRTGSGVPEGAKPGEPASLGGGQAGADSSPQAAGSARAPRVLSLREALEIAVTSGRDYLARRESLYLTALGLTGTRYEFGPRLTAALSYTFADSGGGAANHGAGATAGVSQILPWGGNVALTASENFADSSDSTSRGAFDAGLAVTLTQPLLRGFGREVSQEALTQAERDTLYAIRDFELFREDYSIRVASSYYDLVQQKQTVENQRRNMENLAEERRKAEALFQVGRKPELELLRARRSELTSKNDLIEAEEGLRLALDRFRIFLGLSAEDRVDVRPEEPAFVEIDYDVSSAIQCALANRLDLLNEKERLEDAARSLRISKNGLLPDLTLNAGYDLAADADPSFAGQDLDGESYSAGLNLSIPVDRVLDRNAWRSARIRYRQALRGFELFKDELVVSVQSTFRELERRKQSVEIQKELIADQEKNVRIAQLLFEQGDNSNRDVVEAQQSLLDAKNSLIREQVSYEIARLGLLRDLGVLFIDANGAWKE
jgi:outer membrane protein TolC